MRALVILEHDGHAVRAGSYSAAAFAAAVVAPSGGGVEFLLLGHAVGPLAEAAAHFGRCWWSIMNCSKFRWPIDMRRSSPAWSAIGTSTW